jgi:vacuolar protein sorting-associated protein 72
MEEGNVIQHRDYLMIEEEKRKRARVVRATVEGPLMRWVSKAEEVIVKEYLPPIPFQTPDPRNQYRDQPFDQATGPTQFVVNFHQNTQPSGSEPVQPSSLYESQIHQFHAPNPAPLPPPERKERVEKNYVVVETQQSETAPLPTWKQTMEAMFGDHVKWDEVRVFTGKNRPLCQFQLRSNTVHLMAFDFSSSKRKMSYHWAGRELL